MKCSCAHKRHKDGEPPEGGCPVRSCGCTEYRPASSVTSPTRVVPFTPSGEEAASA